MEAGSVAATQARKEAICMQILLEELGHKQEKVALNEVKNRVIVEDIKALQLITAIKTPYLLDGKFDLEAYDALINLQIENGVEGMIVGGSTCEGQLMTWDEHIKLIGHTINCFGGSIKVIENTGSYSTSEAIHATEQ
ncbi:4-hydroxy-tetrahydrodipicolinate synthase, chloroplastic-like [Solanum dulcamara]|uniref:4-hydroxy-tetrahydrodipicolinate synthase, chloroplastic-like n=1 Tax=Solanum dulcamara TaxID=45834 RepID=UPI0024850132|nr:4-hydroxy-tetrahydrodipicolinate synthase, chloroplastic-like [Solanum dulcamara]